MGTAEEGTASTAELLAAASAEPSPVAAHANEQLSEDNVAVAVDDAMVEEDSEEEGRGAADAVDSEDGIGGGAATPAPPNEDAELVAQEEGGQGTASQDEASGDEDSGDDEFMRRLMEGALRATAQPRGGDEPAYRDAPWSETLPSGGLLHQSGLALCGALCQERCALFS